MALFVALGGTAYASVEVNSVDTRHLRDNAVTAPKIARNAVTASEIRRNAVTGDELHEHSVRASEIAPGAVRSEEVRDGSLLPRDFVGGQLVDPHVYDVAFAFGDETQHAGESSGDSAPCTLSEMALTASNRLPPGYWPADGRLIPINQHQALFSLIGTYYGGDGRTTFALPDMRNVAPNHMSWGICAFGVYPTARG
jgi:hypothetical protein